MRCSHEIATVCESNEKNRAAELGDDRQQQQTAQQQQNQQKPFAAQSDKNVTMNFVNLSEKNR